MRTCQKCGVEYEPETPCTNLPYHYHCPECGERSDGAENELKDVKPEGGLI